MKALKKTFVLVISLLMTFSVCFSMTACAKDDIRHIELTVQVYDYENDKMYETEEVTLTLDLYRHFAPQTVDAIIEYVQDGYYDNAIFYQLSDYSGQIMFGDLKYSDGVVTKNALMPTIDGEFANGMTEGSTLVNKKGSVGLWRTWNAHDGNYNRSSTNTDSGRATWFIPTETKTSYNGWFCVFAQIDLNDESNSTALNAISKAFTTSGEYVNYVIYYTGEYDAQNPDSNDGHGLTFHCVKEDYLDEDLDIFEAKDSELVCYNKQVIRVPVTGPSGEIGAKVVSVKVI